MDERQFGTTPRMALTTREGLIDVLDVVKGVGITRSAWLSQSRSPRLT